MVADAPDDMRQDAARSGQLPDVARLWPQAERIARSLCRQSLWRLRCGYGGFYDDEDMMQDLFLEFYYLAHRLPHTSEEELWRAWRRLLWGHGRRVLRRAPQRLWSGGRVLSESDMQTSAEAEPDGLLDRRPNPAPGPETSCSGLAQVEALDA